MPLDERQLSVLKVSAVIGLVFGPGWFMNNYFYEMGIVSPKLAVVVTYGSYALFGVFGLFFVLMQYRARMQEDPPPVKAFAQEAAFLRWLVFLVFAHSVSGYITGLYVAGRWFINDVLPSLPTPSAAIAGAVVTAVAGSALFMLRWKVRSLYALLEMLTSLLLAAELAPRFIPSDPWNLTFVLTFIPAAVYLFVRGADNLHQAIQKADDDLAFRAITLIGKSWQKRRAKSAK